MTIEQAHQGLDSPLAGGGVPLPDRPLDLLRGGRVVLG
jgi:hypothetical protein